MNRQTVFEAAVVFSKESLVSKVSAIPVKDLLNCS
jgi:hypothetical protein